MGVRPTSAKVGEPCVDLLPHVDAIHDIVPSDGFWKGLHQLDGLGLHSLAFSNNGHDWKLPHPASMASCAATVRRPASRECVIPSRTYSPLNIAPRRSIDNTPLPCVSPCSSSFRSFLPA